MLHGRCMIETRKTIEEYLEEAQDQDFKSQKIIYPIEQPIKKTGHLQILYGNIAQKGSVAKISGKEGEYFEGPARVFEGEYELIEGIESGKVHAGDVVII